MNRRLYTNQTIEKIIQMQHDGSTDKEIATALGTTDKRLASRVSQLGLSRSPRHHDTGTRVHFPEWLITQYTGPAERRGITPMKLIKLLIERIAKDNLFEAVLDDSE
jgi:hypothetical protein